jgi:hypothetical protein
MDMVAPVSMFYVQSSYDGKNFTTINSINSDSKSPYNVKDFSSQGDIVYYRLVYKTNDGKEISSKVFQLNRTDAANNVFPNPFHQQLIIHTQQQSKTLPQIKITNAIGMTIASYTVRVESGNIILNFMNHPSGVYFITLSDGNKTRVYKVLKN